MLSVLLFPTLQSSHATCTFVGSSRRAQFLLIGSTWSQWKQQTPSAFLARKLHTVARRRCAARSPSTSYTSAAAKPRCCRMRACPHGWASAPDVPPPQPPRPRSRPCTHRWSCAIITHQRPLFGETKSLRRFSEPTPIARRSARSGSTDRDAMRGLGRHFAALAEFVSGSRGFF
jgi:hypothetical protein